MCFERGDVEEVHRLKLNSGRSRGVAARSLAPLTLAKVMPYRPGAIPWPLERMTLDVARMWTPALKSAG